LAEFPLVQQKLARMAAWTYAMEAMTTVTAGLIDRGLEDYMLETAMLKVYSTEVLWTIVNDAFQIHGGAAYFADLPLERMLRDARINQIGEGANEVLTSFIALVGIREPGERLRQTAEALRHAWRERRSLGRFVADELSRRFRRPSVPVRSRELRGDAGKLGRRIKRFGLAVQGAIIRHREEILERQLVQEPIAEAAMELYASVCVLARLDAEPESNASPAGKLFLRQSRRRIDDALRRLKDNDNAAIEGVARKL
jgi:alkylation response protein AidB-like acyl-CoA dehydrogenase